MKTETIVGLFVAGAIGVFFYLTFSIGTFRLDRDRYHSYRAFFDDTSGLEKKDPVKIAGVVVGQIDNIKLSREGTAVVFFMVNKQNQLAKNSRAFIRQEGLLGARYLEIDPGDSSTGIMPPGGALGFPASAPASVGEVLNKFSDVASSIRDVANSLRESIASSESQDNIKEALRGFAKASNRMASFSELLEERLRKNEQSIDTMLDKFSKASGELADDTLPSVRSGFDRMGSASEQVEYGFKEAGNVFGKINEGRGFIGKVVNEDETYRDFKKTLRNVRELTGAGANIDVLIDAHSEMLLREWDSKNYIEIRLRPQQDYFYQLQLVTSEKGRVDREVIDFKRFDRNKNQLEPPNICEQYTHPDRVEKTTRLKHDLLMGFQLGKRFNRLVVRGGIFENAGGFGIDYYVPLPTDQFHWVTTFEMFDFQGMNRIDDKRPHLKWLNRLYFLKNMYTAFGIDDFVSKREANPFVGGGFRFHDKNIKMLLPALQGQNLKIQKSYAGN